MSPWPLPVGPRPEGVGGWKALQKGCSITNSTWVFIAPRMRFASFLSFFARGWYWASWFVESRSHSAFISPVTMKEWAPSHFASFCW